MVLSKDTSGLTTLIHPTAVIHPSATIHPSVKIGPYAVIGENVTIGADTVVHAGVVIDGLTEIGVGNQIFPHAVIGMAPQDLKYKGGESAVKIGDYNQIRECVTINRATEAGEVTEVGSNNLLMAYVHVAHNCTIEDNVIIANSVALAGHVYIESKAVIGGVLGVHQFVHVGRMAMLGGMSRIERDVPPFMLVEGNPSKVRTLNLVGLQRAGLSADELSLLKKAFRILYRSDLNLTSALEQLSLFPENPHLQHLQNFLSLSTGGDKRRGLIPGK
ncbi:MAG: acyl-ACP--UDP-N-acetylglucosamine O-acyltransferase [Chlorogloea purpurea SAG 13.99]|jgi:UDP-N-acetylglucosamine acyltransferase|nr:acyl-ACP--UDP-N-acetylglucosamine O-acyltransferase [Chlorogloea purpurea SAG 13.99]